MALTLRIVSSRPTHMEDRRKEDEVMPNDDCLILIHSIRSASKYCTQKKLSSGKGKMLPVGGRVVLINSVLSSLPMFMMSCFRISKGVLEKLDFYRSMFFIGNATITKRNIDLTNGIYLVNLNVLVVWGLLILRYRTSICRVSGCLSF